MRHNIIFDNPFYRPVSIRIHEIHRVPGAVGVGAYGVVLLGQGVWGQPGRGPGIIEPGAEVQVWTAGSCCRGARKRARANPLACNFLATEAVAEDGLRRICAGGPYAALAAKGIIVEPLQDISASILDDTHTAQVVRNLIDWTSP